MTRQLLMNNVYLTYIPSEKFKTSFLSAQMAAPLEKETAGRNALLVNVLNRGTVRCPDMAAIGRELDMLYGARLEPTVRKKGENQLFGFVASCVDDRFLPKGEKLLEKLTDLLGEFYCSPITRGGRLLEEYVESERENLADLIRSDINDKRSYAARRLLEEMCAGERYGVGRMGSAKDVEKISLQKLNSYYHDVLPKGRLELFYCGSAPEKRVAGAFTRAFAALPRQGGLEPAATVRRPPREPAQVVEEEMDVSQGKLCIGCHHADERHVRRHQQLQALFERAGKALSVLLRRQRLSPAEGPDYRILRHRVCQLRPGGGGNFPAAGSPEKRRMGGLGADRGQRVPPQQPAHYGGLPQLPGGFCNGSGRRGKR